MVSNLGTFKGSDGRGHFYTIKLNSLKTRVLYKYTRIITAKHLDFKAKIFEFFLNRMIVFKLKISCLKI